METTQVNEQQQHHPITIDAFREAKADIFALIIDTDEFMRANGVSSITLISEAFSTTSRIKQLDSLIEALQLVKQKLHSEEIASHADLEAQKEQKAQ